MSRTDSLLTVVIQRAADLLARDPRIPHDARVAYRQTAEHVLRSQFAAVCGGERVYAPKVADVERQASRERILQALASGEPVAAVARRERVDPSWVRRLRRRGTLRP